MKQFNDKAILTSKNPEAFLNFTYDTTNYWIIPDCCIGVGLLNVNGLDINAYDGASSLDYALVLDSNNTMASFLVNSDDNNEFDVNLHFKLYDSSLLNNLVSTVDVSISNRPFNTGLNTLNNEDLLVDDQASYLLMRTNPKFTGNIKLYVDASNNLYLDTFKVSDILNNKKYRHQQRSANSVLSSDIRNVFSTLPLGELYRVDVDNTLSIAIPKTDYANQYNTTYNYGARLLEDELYPEDNGLLAPLWINSQLPDYFAVFRLNGNYNQETYDGSALTNLAFKYLEQSKLIRSWSMKPASPLGTYLQTHLNDLIKIQTPVFLSLTDPDIAIAESDPNTWYGMAVDKGVLTGRSETTYFFNQNADNLTNLDAFMSQGFERNTLLCPNLINLEFAFDDNDVSLYSMSRYFGFYLTENVLYKVAYYADSSTGPISILSLDGKDSSTFMHSSIFDASGNITSEYTNRIFVLNDEVQLQRFTNVNQINETQFNQYVSKPYKNIFSTVVEKTNIAPFITLTLNGPLDQGEHLRLINKTQNKIWEVYSIDASDFKCDTYVAISENAGYPTVYRTYFDMNGDIAFQAEQIQIAFDRFGDYPGTQFRAGLHGDNWVSLILNDDASFGEEWMFQRITSTTLNDFNDPSSGFNSASSPGDITFNGRFTPTVNDFQVIALDASFGPIDFELFGDRESIMLNLINRQNNNFYSFDSSKNILDQIAEPTLYQGNDLWWRRLLDMDVSNNAYLYVKDPLHIEDKVLIMTAEEILLFQGKYNAASIYPLNISLMGINPVKDIDYTVYDSSLGFKSEYFYNREDDVSSYYVSVDVCAGYTLNIPGSYVVQSGNGTLTQNAVTTPYDISTLFNTFDSSVYISANTASLITYAVLDGSFNYKGYDASAGVTEESIGDYYVSNQLLKYGLTVPLVSKWVGLGTDARNNPLRLILDASIFDVSTNFIPTSTSFSQEISYPSFKYLGTEGRAWQDYVFYDINDIVHDPDTSVNLTFKEAMFEHPFVDYFSKLVYSNNNVDATKIRSSIVYYNGYKNTIDTIFLGLNLSIQVQNIAKNILDIKNYDRYRFSFISTSSKNKDNKRPIEVIINENTKTILMIWYQGNDELNYNKRYSSFLPGKSLFDPSSLGFVSGVNDQTYSFIKTPFFVNNSTIQKTLEKLYDIDLTYDSSLARPYAQLNKNLLGFSSAWNAFGDNVLTNAGIFQVDGNKNYETFNQIVDYNYAQNPNTFGDYVVNYGYHYNSNLNEYVNNTTNFDTLSYILSSGLNYVMYYIIRDTNIYTSYDFGSIVSPLSITINPPRSYRDTYTYNGWFKPKFNNILEFKSDETTQLINVVNRDFIFSNTNLRLYNDIPQLWFNEVVNVVTAADISVGNAISYMHNFNVFKALWDADYYFNSQTASYVAGYQSPTELPSFFGSKLVKLPDKLPLDNWDVTTATYTTTTTDITLSFNLTRAIINKFKTNNQFINNWNGLSNADNIIDAYIKNTAINYYNISVPKIEVDYYYKPFDGVKLHFINDSTFINDPKQNFNGQLVYQNDEYIYNLKISITGNYSYYIKFVMTEK
jgi:hypothetical protein